MSRRLLLPFDQWPESDVAMWSTLRCDGGLLEDPGKLSHLRETSLKALKISYSRWLGWLKREDPPALLLKPTQRAVPGRLQTWLKSELANNAPMSRAMLIDNVLRVLMAADPTSNWAMHIRLKALLRKQAKQNYGARKTGRIVSSALLFNTALDLAGRLADEATTELEANKCRRNGALIAFLAVMPIRSRSVVELALGTSLHVSPSALTVRLSEDMTKNGLPWEARVPEELEPTLRQYIDIVRPWLLARGNHAHDIFWVIDCGRPFTAGYLRMKVSAVTKRFVGVDVPPHFFRDAAATSLSRQSPENARLIRPLLGHASHGTAERHYIRAGTVEAGRNFADVLKQLKS